MIICGYLTCVSVHVDIKDFPPSPVVFHGGTTDQDGVSLITAAREVTSENLSPFSQFMMKCVVVRTREA